MVYLFNSLFSVWVDLYQKIQRLFALQGELPEEGLHPVVKISHEAFA